MEMLLNLLTLLHAYQLDYSKTLDSLVALYTEYIIV